MKLFDEIVHRTAMTHRRKQKFSNHCQLMNLGIIPLRKLPLHDQEKNNFQIEIFRYFHKTIMNLFHLFHLIF